MCNTNFLNINNITIDYNHLKNAINKNKNKISETNKLNEKTTTSENNMTSVSFTSMPIQDSIKVSDFSFPSSLYKNNTTTNNTNTYISE